MIRPLFDRVIIERELSPATTPGGIAIPERTLTKLNRGTVLATGPGRFLEDGSVVAMQVGVGDRVMFSPYGGSEVEVGGKMVLIVPEGDVLARLT
jgi:chaperonin GroES